MLYLWFPYLNHGDAQVTIMNSPCPDRGPDDPTALELFRHLATSVGAWSRVSAPGVLSTRRNGTVIPWWVMSHYLVGGFKHDWNLFHNIWDNHDNPSH